MRWSTLVVTILGLLGPTEFARADSVADAAADATLTYETVEPARIKLGQSATIRVISLDGYVKGVALPTVPGLDFEIIGRSQGVEFLGGTAVPSTSLLIRVTPQFAGLFTIPGLTPNSKSLGLEVVGPDEPNRFAWERQKPAPAPLPIAPLPKGVQLRANGAAFVSLNIPERAVYVGESVPVEIELGVRPGIVTSVNGLPALSGSDFTLGNLTKQPNRRDQEIEGSAFVIMTWHSVLAAVKPGDFSLSAETPLTVKINSQSAADTAFSAKLGWPFLQSMYNGVVPKDLTIASPASQLKVLPLPTEGRPKDFHGAVGDFEVASEVSSTRVAAGEPITLRLHISGSGNFDRVDATMFDHLDHWKTYPAKASFKPSDSLGYKGEKIFEQPLIAAQAGEQSIPALEFSYFSPLTQHYEHAHTSPITVMIAASLADTPPSALSGTPSLEGALTRSIAALRPDHRRSGDSVNRLNPLYFRAPFLAVPATLALILAGILFAVRSDPPLRLSEADQRALAQLDAAARSGDSSSFLELARQLLLQIFSERWQLPHDQITVAELQARLGTASAEIERLFALADEAKYSDRSPARTDYQRWQALIRGHLSAEGA